MKRKWGITEKVFLILVIAVFAVFGGRKFFSIYNTVKSDETSRSLSTDEAVTVVAGGEEQKPEKDSYQVDVWKYSYEILDSKILKELPFEPQEHASGIQFDGNRIVNDYSIVSVTMTIEDNNDISPNKIETLNSHQLHVDKMQNTKTHKYELYMSSIGEEPDPMDDFHYQMKYGEKSEPVTLYYLVSDDDLTGDANINLLLNPMGAYGSKTTYKLKDENVTAESVKKYAFIKLNDLLRKSEEY